MYIKYTHTYILTQTDRQTDSTSMHVLDFSVVTSQGDTSRQLSS